jgi:hypothetical protein
MLCLVGKSQAGQPVTIRLYPLHAEHVLPLVGDLLFFVVAYGFWLGAGLGDSWCSPGTSRPMAGT